MSKKPSRSKELDVRQIPTIIQRVNHPVLNGEPNPAHGKYFFTGAIPARLGAQGLASKYGCEELAIDNAIAHGATKIQRVDCSVVDFRQEAIRHITFLKQFIPRQQLQVMADGLRREEKAFFRAKFAELYLMINAMPHEYQQSQLGEKAIIYLHYFTGSQDWWITEKDSDADGEGQLQCFGQTNIGYDDELGYVDVSELLKHAHVNLDLHFKPRTIEQLNEKRSRHTEPEVAIVAPPDVPSVGEVAPDAGAESRAPVNGF